MTFGDAAGSFSIADGIVSVPTASLKAESAEVLADATLDLNTLDLASTWTVRVHDGAPGDQPEVRVFFSGPIAAPDRRIDLAQLLQLLSVRYQERQIARIEELQRQQQEDQAEASGPTSSIPLAEPPGIAPEETAPAENPEVTDPASPPPQPSGDALPFAPELEVEPPGSVAPLDLVPERIAPELQSSDPPPPPPPADPPQQQAAPPPQNAPLPPADPPRRFRVFPGAPPTSAEPPNEEFRTLPNGVVVKVR
jgi:hypothetical protein